MKRLILAALFLSFFSSAFAQCDQNMTLKSLVGRFVQGDTKQADVPLEATVTIDNEKIIFTASMGGRSETISNTIEKVIQCEWVAYMKDGQTIYKVLTDRGNGTITHSIVKIYSKEGKTSIYFGSDPDENGGLKLDIHNIKMDD